MQLGEFIAFVEAHSTPGSALAFRDVTPGDGMRDLYGVSPESTYSFELRMPRLLNRRVTLCIYPDRDGGYLLRDPFLELLRSLDSRGARESDRFALALYHSEDDGRLYLDGSVWASIDSPEDNVFELSYFGDPSPLEVRIVNWEGGGANGCT